MKELPILERRELDLESLPKGQTSRLRIHLVSNGMGDPIQVPVIVIKGKEKGPVMGITAAVHGNELNGLPVIYELAATIQPKKLKGTIITVPVVNIPGFLENSRYYRDNADLNRIFPGKAHGTASEIYAYYFMEKIAQYFEYSIDLHTASFGRINSLYVRADLNNSVTSRMARLQNPQIIVHKEGPDGSLRSALADRKIPSITVEVGNPLRFQRKLIRSSLLGVLNVLRHLKMISRQEKEPKGTPILCRDSFWLYTDKGGILEVLPDIRQMVKKGETVAFLRNVYGDIIDEYKAPEDGVVIGKSINPVGDAGSRILHLGIVDGR
ncbi:MAG: peptidase M14 [Planctomycetota bacterium]|nr:MAG: peptidase M14 [Planctomycetota bacterium]